MLGIFVCAGGVYELTHATGDCYEKSSRIIMEKLFKKIQAIAKNYTFETET